MITTHTLNNGVRLIIEPIPTVRSATIGIWIGTGSRYETPKTNGVSHFLEHMFFKGTKTRSARDIAEAFDRIGGYVNAFTSKEYTCVYAKVLDERVEFAFNMLADMFFHSTFAAEEIIKERKVVLEEIKMYEDTPDDIVHDLLSLASYDDHPLAMPILGTEETLQTFNQNILKDFMNKYYTPENIVISVAGNVSENIFRQIEAHFGHYISRYSKPSVNAPVFHKKVITEKKNTEQAHLCLGFPGIPYGDDDIYDLVLLNNILGGSMSSRLFQQIREEKGLAYSVFSHHSSFKDSGLVTIYAGTAPDQLDFLLEAIFATLEQLSKEGITEDELHNSKEQLKGNLMLSLESTSSRMSRNGKNILLLGRIRSLDEMTDLIDSVTQEGVNQLAERIFTEQFSGALISPKGVLPSMLM